MIFEDFSEFNTEKLGIIKVRHNEQGFYLYTFPLKDIEPMLRVFEKSKIYYEIFPCDCSEIEDLPIKESRISIKNLDKSECVALYCDVDINEIYEIIRLLSDDPSFVYRIEYLRNSELPEFREVLSELALNELNTEQQSVYRGYMTALLDMRHGDLWDMVDNFSKSSGFDRLLRYYTDDVRKYIYNNITDM